jgi:pyruvate/2-oxoglutarate dehydrogenase complex dihydrolipoamide acyltransferase (E2) component
LAHFHRLRTTSSWRRISLHAWRAPRDPSVYGMLDIDATRALGYLEGINRGSATKVTLTHLVGKAVADAIAVRPEVNAVIRRGRQIYQRDSVDVFFQIALDGGEDLSGAKVVSADQKSVAEIAHELHDRAERIRAHGEHALKRNTELLSRLPAVARGAALHVSEYLSYDLGLDLSALGIPYDAFGSAMVTNVGMFGLPRGLAPLVPFSRAPIVITVGALEQRPLVVDGQVQARPVLPLGATLDHRLLDGFQAGELARRFRAVLEDPESALGAGR